MRSIGLGSEAKSRTGSSRALNWVRKQFHWAGGGGREPPPRFHSFKTELSKCIYSARCTLDNGVGSLFLNCSENLFGNDESPRSKHRRRAAPLRTPLFLAGRRDFAQQPRTQTVELPARPPAHPGRVENSQEEAHPALGGRVQDQTRIPDSQTHVYASPDHGLSYLSDYNMTFWIGFQHQSKHHILIGTQDGHLVLFELSDIDDSDARTVSITLNEAIASKAMAFSYYDEQWFAIKQSYGNTTWIRFYQRVDRGLEGRQTIVLEGEADFDLVTVKGVHYLAVVTSPNQSMLTLYHWTQTQFDRIASRTVHGARSVACWALDGSLYVAVAQEGRASPVYFYNAKGDGELVLLQMLDAEGPRKVMHFYASGGHYVAFVGRRDATIYWWSNDQFLRWQTIGQTASASDASVFALDNGEAMIVIALQEEALFYAVDASGRFMRIFSMHLSGYLASMQFMYSGKNHYALVFLRDRPQLVWKLIMDSYYMPTAASLNPLQQCLQDLDAVLGERQGHIDAALPRLRRVWLRDGRQNVTAEVVVTEVTSSTKPSDIALVLVISLRKTLPATSIPAAENAISNIRSIVDGLLRSVKDSVLKSGTQTIAGNKQFTEAIAVPFLNLESTSRDVPINGIPVSRIGQFALRKFGNQTLWYPTIVENVQAEDVLANALNSILVDDLLLLGGDQEASGTLKFSKILVSDVLVASVNSISVDDFVTVGSNQMIGHLKTVSVLRCSIIDVQGHTNGENLAELNQRVVSILDDWEIKGRLTVKSVLHIAANVFLIGSLNGVIDVNHLDLNSVKKHTEQNLKGQFIFTSACNVFEYVNISGYMNNVNVGQLVTLSTPQIISGDVAFGELLTLDRGLTVDYVNDVDLNRTAIVKMDEPQFVTGFVSFVEHLQVKHIAMTEYVTLDAVDPSMFVQDIVKHEEGVVKNDKILFHNVVVLGDIIAIDGINGYKISDLPNVVWLKSNPQVVEMPVTITKLTAKADLEAKLVNRLHFDTDLVHSFRNESITSIKTFINDVSITDHIDLEATLINGLEVTSLKNETSKIYKFSNYLGVTNKESFFPSLYYAKNPKLFLSGDIKFISELMVVPDLVSGNVNLNTFKNIHLQEYINNVVLKTNRQYTIANKIFSIIRASNLILDNESTIDGTKFSEMAKRVVTLDTRQEIIARKTFPHDLHLHSFSNVSYLNDRDWRRIINNIVFVAESSSIESFKTFNG
ncbi:uncharacterized protein CEXT_659381 [Caerostris extrusa]|uniref:Uncharacterized protein n=1 Tax=Caerostris extrusa TaxID=172846 RepID=A0AAV4RVT0_CAEEX|nr:uncharacterized protein CEXT_659381 [Caerostris extrusa]